MIWGKYSCSNYQLLYFSEGGGEEEWKDVDIDNAKPPHPLTVTHVNQTQDLLVCCCVVVKNSQINEMCMAKRALILKAPTSVAVVPIMI